MKKLLLMLSVCLLAVLAPVASADTEFSLESYKGKVVYVDFWASWCTPCRASFPFMQAMAETHGDALEIVAINVDKDRSDAAHFLEQFEINFDIVYDPKGMLAKSFDVKGMPTSYLYDRKGQLVGSHIGFKKKDISKLEAAIAMTIKNEEL